MSARSHPEAARRELGGRLRRIRRLSGLTARALAAAIGVHPTTLSKIENGVRPPSERQLADWCTACAADEQADELLAALWSVESAYEEWQRLARTGMRRIGGPDGLAIYRDTGVFRVFEPFLLPGIFQTEPYIRALLDFHYSFFDIPRDADEAVQLRLDRAAIALAPTRKVAAVVAEQALRTRFTGPEEHAGQLLHLMTLMRAPTVSVGIVPAGVRRSVYAATGFWIFDAASVAVETLTAGITVTRPHEIQLYLRMFAMLRTQAVYGGDARRLVTKAMDAL